MGKSGQELGRILSEIGINRGECSFTNVMEHHPPDNDFDIFTAKKAEVSHEYKEVLPYLAKEHPRFAWPMHYRWPAIASGKYLRPAYLNALPRLEAEIEKSGCNLVVALGNIAMWALLGKTGIRKFRGTILPSNGGYKVLPTYHPAAVLRQWSLRPIVAIDLAKAIKEQHSKEIVRSPRYIHIPETISDIEEYVQQEIIPYPSKPLGVDVETAKGMITMFGIAASESSSIVIPFQDLRFNSYWSEEDEIAAWKLCRRAMNTPNPKVFQNGMYDVQYKWRQHGFTFQGPMEDTMLMHHAQEPEVEKSLGFLGSIYTEESAWKTLHKFKDEGKRED